MIIALLIIALGLASALLLMGRAAPPAAPPAPLVTAPARDINAVTIAWAADGSLATQMRRLDDGTWVARWTLGAAQGSWPVIPSRVAGALGLLAKVQGTTLATAETQGEPVGIELAGPAGTTTLTAAKRPFGGVGAVIRPAQGALPALAADVDGQLIQVFQRQDVMAWRDLSVFPGDLSQTARIYLPPPTPAPTEGVVINGPDAGASSTGASTTGGPTQNGPSQNGPSENGPSHGPTLLQRVGSRWALLQPVRVPADRAQIEGYIALLKKLRIARFPAEQPGWAGAKDGDFNQLITLETDRRNPDASGPGSTWTIRHSLELGPFAGEQSTLARASVSIIKDGKTEYLWGPTILMVEAATDAELIRPAEAFVNRIAARAVPADIRGLRLVHGSKAYAAQRSLEDWNDPAGKPVTLLKRDALRGIISLLAETPASRVHLGASVPPPDASENTWTVDLLGAGGTPPLDSVRVWKVESSGELWANQGPLTLVYTGEPAAAWDGWIKALSVP